MRGAAKNAASWKRQAVAESARVALGWLVLTCVTYGQEPSAALKRADAAYRAGQAALARQDLAAAQAAFETVVTLAPANEQGHSALGTVLLERGQTRAGIRELERALAIQKTDRNAELNLALAYQQVGSSAKAVALFSLAEQAARSSARPLPPQALEAYARALAATGKPALAAAQISQALAAQPESATLHDELGSLDAQQKQWPAAQKEFAEATRLEPALAAAHLHLGLAMQAQGDPGAWSELLRAKALAPQDAEIALAAGDALAAAGQDQQAIPLYRQVLEQAPGSTAAMYALALALQRTGKVEEAIALLRRVVAAEPDNATALTNLGLALSQAQLAQDAAPLLQKAIALTPQSPTAHQNLAAAYVQLNRLRDAENELRAALRLAPNSPELHYDLGVALKLDDKTKEAMAELQAARRLDPGSPEAAYALGVLYTQQGSYEQAAEELSAALKLRPANGEGWAMLGSVYGKLDRLQEGVAALREAIHQLPDQPAPHLDLASLLLKQNQIAEAAAERKTAAAMMRANMNHQRAEIAANAGKAALGRGDLAAAEAQFEDAQRYDATNAEAHLGLARVFESRGKPIEAAAERQKASALAGAGAVR